MFQKAGNRRNETKERMDVMDRTGGRKIKMRVGERAGEGGREGSEEEETTSEDIWGNGRGERQRDGNRERRNEGGGGKRGRREE